MTPSFDGLRALILHREHANTEALQRQFERIGAAAVVVWPELPADFAPEAFGVLFFDADMGHDGQFPWTAGEAPLPTVALIGSEAPGRVTWAVSHGADAQLLKPIGSSGVYSALVIATHSFNRRKALSTRIAALSERLETREMLAEATAILMVRHGLSAAAAYQRLRRAAMDERLTIDDMAARIVLQIRSEDERSLGR